MHTKRDDTKRKRHRYVDISARKIPKRALLFCGASVDLVHDLFFFDNPKPRYRADNRTDRDDIDRDKVHPRPPASYGFHIYAYAKAYYAKRDQHDAAL